MTPLSIILTGCTDNGPAATIFEIKAGNPISVAEVSPILAPDIDGVVAEQHGWVVTLASPTAPKAPAWLREVCSLAFTSACSDLSALRQGAWVQTQPGSTVDWLPIRYIPSDCLEPSFWKSYSAGLGDDSLSVAVAADNLFTQHGYACDTSPDAVQDLHSGSAAPSGELVTVTAAHGITRLSAELRVGAHAPLLRGSAILYTTQPDIDVMRAGTRVAALCATVTHPSGDDPARAYLNQFAATRAWAALAALGVPLNPPSDFLRADIGEQAEALSAYVLLRSEQVALWRCETK